MAVRVSWQQALAWRMKRHQLEPVGRLPVEGVVRRLCGVQAQVASSAELAVRLRRERSRLGEVGRALSEGRLIKTWAMRGALHLLTPEEGAAFLSLMASGRSWERPSWQRYFGVTADVMDALRGVVREALRLERPADRFRARRQGMVRVGAGERPRPLLVRRLSLKRRVLDPDPPTRTRIMPRWLGVAGYLVALALLVRVGLTGWIGLLLPLWILLLSIDILRAGLGGRSSIREDPVASDPEG